MPFSSGSITLAVPDSAINPFVAVIRDSGVRSRSDRLGACTPRFQTLSRPGSVTGATGKILCKKTP